MLSARAEGQDSTLVCDDAQGPPKSYVFSDTRHVGSSKPDRAHGCRLAGRAPRSATPVPSSVTLQQMAKATCNGLKLENNQPGK